MICAAISPKMLKLLIEFFLDRSCIGAKSDKAVGELYSGGVGATAESKASSTEEHVDICGGKMKKREKEQKEHMMIMICEYC